MSETMIEQMARRVYERQADLDPYNFVKWQDTPLVFRFTLKQSMRDALAVLREPTEGVLAAIRDGQPIAQTHEEIWQAAIDAVLAEDPGK